MGRGNKRQKEKEKGRERKDKMEPILNSNSQLQIYCVHLRASPKLKVSAWS